MLSNAWWLFKVSSRVLLGSSQPPGNGSVVIKPHLIKYKFWGNWSSVEVEWGRIGIANENWVGHE